MSGDRVMRTYRVLVTGSRNWTDEQVIKDALWYTWAGPLQANAEAVLIQGECEFGGADLIAKEVWHAMGLEVESYPAEKDALGRILGPKRNQEMVNTGADLCLAFPLPGSRGTRNCMRLARNAGIPVLEFKPGERVASRWTDFQDIDEGLSEFS